MDPIHEERPGDSVNNPIVIEDEEEMDLEEEPEIQENTDSESEGEVENMDDTPDFTSPVTFERYNHLCLYHRGYYPRRGTGTNRTNRDVTGIMIKIKTWSSGRDPSRYLNIIRGHADLYDLELHLQQEANPATKTLVERILSIRRWRKMTIIADNSWRQHGNIYPDYGNLVVIYKGNETEWDEV
uniref:Uncharacterized protein n=1 Tax=Strongyloides papillosus TaxID=174720 RepID=A0A0N5BRN1_STREA